MLLLQALGQLLDMRYINPIVRVDKSDIFPRRLNKPTIAGCADALVFLRYHRYPGVGFGVPAAEIQGAVTGAVVNNKNL